LLSVIACGEDLSLAESSDVRRIIRTLGDKEKECAYQQTANARMFKKTRKINREILHSNSINAHGALAD
jgi:hypothetical protein